MTEHEPDLIRAGMFSLVAMLVVVGAFCWKDYSLRTRAIEVCSRAAVAATMLDKQLVPQCARLFDALEEDARRR